MVECSGYGQKPTNDGKEQQQPLYSKAARFVGEKSQAKVYLKAKEIIFTCAKEELSVYRLMFNSIYHVVILGEQAAEATDQALTEILSQGDIVALPSEVLTVLNNRRLQTKQNRPSIGGYHQPSQQQDEG